MEDIKLGRYKINSNGQVLNIICKEDPDGNHIYDPFAGGPVLPFWGTMVTTFEGLNQYNKDYILKNLDRYGLNDLDIRLQKYWLFWFSDGSLENQKELFFIGPKAKEEAHLVLHIFNSILESNIDALIKNIKLDINTLEK